MRSQTYSGIVFCDSLIALQTRNSPNKGAGDIADATEINAYDARERRHVMQFVRIPSHVGIREQ